MLTLGMMMLNYESGRTAEINALHKYVKVNVDYSKDIIGLWEGVEMTGYETYGNAETMKWSALREKEGGSRFNTTFTWKKITL